MKWNEMKGKEIKQNEMKWNETKENETKWILTVTKNLLLSYCFYTYYFVYQ
jgi:hypothetical protein